MASKAGRAELQRECLDALDDLESTMAALRDQMRRLQTTLRKSRRFLEAGGAATGLSELTNVAELRAADDKALRDFEAARLRAQHALYRLGAEDGVSAAEIGRVFGVSRQLVSRILNDRERRTSE
jgi:CRP-like cAMP-binding protein